MTNIQSPDTKSGQRCRESAGPQSAETRYLLALSSPISKMAVACSLTCLVTAALTIPGCLADEHSDANDSLLSFSLPGGHADYLYVAIVLDAPISSGFFRGASLPLWEGQKLVRLDSSASQVTFSWQPDSYIQERDEHPQLGQVANLSGAFHIVPIVSSDNSAQQSITIDANSLFLSQTLTQLVNPLDGTSIGDSEFVLGTLDNSSSGVISTMSTTDEITATVRYTFENRVRTESMETFADSRQTTILVQHSFIRPPATGYLPRLADSRVGYFVERKTNLAEVGPNSERDYIRRWDLRKKVPGDALSEPEQPIVFWLDNAIPSEFHDAVRRGALAWNIAFEQAGFEDAIKVLDQPANADWGFEDLSTNLIQWQLTPESWFGNGLSQVISDPRTGQIIAADVTLDHRRIIQFAKFAGFFFHTAQPDDASRLARKLTEQFVQELTLHEVGHALGLTHNFRGSQAYSVEQLNDPSFTQERGISGSAMDLLPTNFQRAADEEQQFHQLGPGAYDSWAIEYGYAKSLPDADKEKARVSKLLARSTEPGMAYGNDSEVMWTAGTGIDPTIVAWDNSTDALRYAETRIQEIDAALESLPKLTASQGADSIDIVDAWQHLLWLRQSQIDVVAGFIGGIYKQQLVDEVGSFIPELVPVERATQERAVQILIDRMFDVDATPQTPQLLSRLVVRSRDFDLSNRTEDPKVHEAVLENQEKVLDRILSPEVFNRLVDTSLYGGSYDADDLLDALTRAIFTPSQTERESAARENLQYSYVQSLCDIVTGGRSSDYLATGRASALLELDDLVPPGIDDAALINLSVRRCLDN